MRKSSKLKPYDKCNGVFSFSNWESGNMSENREFLTILDFNLISTVMAR
jgi:hypothetical protein